MNGALLGPWQERSLSYYNKEPCLVFFFILFFFPPMAAATLSWFKCNSICCYVWKRHRVCLDCLRVFIFIPMCFCFPSESRIHTWWKFYYYFSRLVENVWFYMQETRQYFFFSNTHMWIIKHYPLDFTMNILFYALILHLLCLSIKIYSYFTIFGI